MSNYESIQRRKAQKAQQHRWTLTAGSHVWCYLRHSPGDNQTIDSQKAGMIEWCAANGWVIDDFFIDEAIEGSREDREQFQRMISLAHRDIRDVDGIAVWSFSRFARSQLDAQFYKADLRKRGYVIVSKVDDIPGNEMAPIYEAFIDWKNQRFLEDLSADVKRGLSFVVETGFWPGGKPPFGYRAKKVEIGRRRNGEPRFGNRLVKDEELSARVALAWKMKLEGNDSLQEIHEATHLYSKREHYSHFFGNLMYAGIFVYHGKRFPIDWEQGATFCEPYVTLEQYLSVQKQRLARTRVAIAPRRLASPYLLTGLLFCGLCAERDVHAPMNGYYKKQFSATRAYRCATKMHGRGTDCAMPRTPTWLVDDAVYADLFERVLTAEYMQSSLEAAQEGVLTSQSDIEQRLYALDAEFNDVKERLSRLLTVIEGKNMNDLLEQQYDRLNERYLVLTAQISQLKASKEQLAVQPITEYDLKLYVDDIRATLTSGPIDEQQVLLRQFIRRVTLYLDRVEIEYNFQIPFGPDRNTFTRLLPQEDIGGLCVGSPWGHRP